VIRLAVVGAGRIGAVHAANVVAHSEAELAWVVSPRRAPAERLAQGRARVTSDLTEALADVDGVIVCSPTPTHVALISAATAAGKAVLSEKPVDLDLGRARDCLHEVAARGGRVMIGFNRRFDPTFAEIRDRVAQGEIGRLEQLVITSRDPAPPPADYAAASGGLFVDMAIHDLDLGRFFLGPIVAVQAVGQNVVDPAIAAAGDVDAAVIVLEAASGATATIIDHRRCVFGYDQRLEAFGASGMLQARNQQATSVALSTRQVTGAAGRAQDFFIERYAAAYRRELDSFVSAVASGGRFEPSLADGVAALELAQAAATAARTGQRVLVGGD